MLDIWPAYVTGNYHIGLMRVELPTQNFGLWAVSAVSSLRKFIC